jgi:hypothetical protein
VEHVELLVLIHPDEIGVDDLDLGHGIANAEAGQNLRLYLEPSKRRVRQKAPRGFEVSKEPRVLERAEELPRPQQKGLKFEVRIFGGEGLHPPRDVLLRRAGSPLRFGSVERAPRRYSRLIPANVPREERDADEDGKPYGRMPEDEPEDDLENPSQVAAAVLTARIKVLAAADAGQRAKR